MKNLKSEQIEQLVLDKTAEKYRRREIEYPVEFAMNMVFGPACANIYGIEALSRWANKKFEASLSTEDIQTLKPAVLFKRLLEFSEKLNNGQLEQLIEVKVNSLDTEQLIQWANERFNASFTQQSIGQSEERKQKILEAGKEFLRQELADLERYVLLQVFDGAWKDHLYVMDHLKEGIGLRHWQNKTRKPNTNAKVSDSSKRCSRQSRTGSPTSSSRSDSKPAPEQEASGTSAT